MRYLKEVSAPATAQKEAGQTGENELAIENTGDGMRLSTAGNYSEDKPNVMAWITLVVGTIMGVLVTLAPPSPPPPDKPAQQGTNHHTSRYHTPVSQPPRAVLKLPRTSYNIALEAAKQGGDDMAILQLKKVVSLHPNFIRARQLLALLYLHTGQKERAKKHLLYAAQIDVANTTTLRYLKEVSAPASSQAGFSQTRRGYFSARSEQSK